MLSRPRVVLVGLAAALATIVLATRLSPAGPGAPPSAVPATPGDPLRPGVGVDAEAGEGPARSRPVASTDPVEASTAPLPPSEAPDGVDTHGHEPVEHQTQRRGVGPAVDADLAAAATARIVAATSGVGRQDWPDLDGTVCCTAVAVTGLVGVPVQDGEVVRLLVAWTGTHPDGTSVSEVTPSRWRHTADGWLPVIPGSEPGRTPVVRRDGPRGRVARRSRWPTRWPRPPRPARRRRWSARVWRPPLAADISRSGRRRRSEPDGQVSGRDDGLATSPVSVASSRAPKALRIARGWTWP
jgi:hypothetical protein